MFKRIPLGVLVALALSVAACGGGDEPEPAARSATVDQAFVNRMAGHADVSRRFAQAAAKDAKDAGVRKLAARMADLRLDERDQLRAFQQRLGGATGGKDPLGVSPQRAGEELRVEMLRNATAFDRAWMQLMIQHHQGALAMIEAERKSGKDAAARALAEQLGVRRADELNQLQDRLAKAAG